MFIWLTSIIVGAFLLLISMHMYVSGGYLYGIILYTNVLYTYLLVISFTILVSKQIKTSSGTDIWWRTDPNVKYFRG